MDNAHDVADAKTLDRARDGDRDALAQLWRTYHPQLLRFLRSQRSPAVEDVASDAWIDVGRAIGRFEGDGRSFQRWLFTIAARRTVDEHRRITRRREVPDDDTQNRSRKHGSADPADTDDGVDAAIAMLQQLPPNMAAAVMLRSVYGLSVAETAEIIGCSEENARVLAHRGLTRLRASVGHRRPHLHAVPDEVGPPTPAAARS